MGVSTDAYISFGIDLGESLSYSPDGEEDVYFGHEVQVVLRDILKKYDLEIFSHCSMDYPMFILCYSPTLRHAWRGYPVELDLNKLEGCIMNGGFESFHSFVFNNPNIAKQLGLEDAGEPKWLLCSDWS